MKKKLLQPAKFKIGDFVEIKCGAYGIILKVMPQRKYEVGFDDGQIFIYNEDNLISFCDAKAQRKVELGK